MSKIRIPPLGSTQRERDMYESIIKRRAEFAAAFPDKETRGTWGDEFGDGEPTAEDFAEIDALRRWYEEGDKMRDGDVHDRPGFYCLTCPGRRPFDPATDPMRGEWVLDHWDDEPKWVPTEVDEHGNCIEEH